MSREHSKRSRAARCADRTPQSRRRCQARAGGSRPRWLRYRGLLCRRRGSAQTAVKVPKPEEKDKAEKAVKKEQEKKAQRTSVIEFRGQTAFNEKELRSQSEGADHHDRRLRSDRRARRRCRLFPRAVLSQARLRQGQRPLHDRVGRSAPPRYQRRAAGHAGMVNFVGNQHQPAEDSVRLRGRADARTLFEACRQKLPFVAADVEEGADLVHRLYIANGYLDAKVDKPIYHYADDGPGRRDHPDHRRPPVFLRPVNFSGETIYGSEALRGQLLDLLEQPYTDGRVSDIPRRLQTYYRTRGYYEVKVDAIGNPAAARQWPGAGAWSRSTRAGFIISTA